MRRTRKKRKSTVYTGGSPHEKCIFVDFTGGLGNFLYIYAAGLLVKHKTGLPLCLYRPHTEHSNRDYREIVDGTPVETREREKNSKNIFHGMKNKYKLIKNSNISYNSSKNRNIKIDPQNYYHNYESIHKLLPEIREMLIKNEFHKEAYAKFKTMIDSSTSAFMHIRRGDYIAHKVLLDISYYYRALDELEKNEKIQKIYILSDDLKWCKEHDSKWKEHTKKSLEYIEGANELETLYCMMLCEAGAIISNSTFSSWGAMLGPDINKDSTIVYPDPWFENEYGNVVSFPKRWIAIHHK